MDPLVQSAGFETAAAAPPGPGLEGPAALQPPSAADELGALVGWGAALFYLAESDVNPGVQSYWDALHYIATSLSVGYANIFPVTPLGKTIGSVVMMLGPALSARVLEPGRSAGGSPAPAAELGAPLPPPGERIGERPSQQIVERLDAILDELRRSPAPA